MRTLLIAVISFTLADAAFAGGRDKYPFTSRSTTLREQFADASAILYGRVENARGNSEFGQTDLVVLDTLRSHPTLKDRKVVTMNRFLTGLDPKKPKHFIVAADHVKNQWDFYWGMEAGERELAYLRGILKLDPTKPVPLVRYCLDHLGESETISVDAAKEIDLAPESDQLEAARDFAAEKLRAMVQAKAPVSARNLAAFLLAANGTPQDADMLAKLLKKDDLPSAWFAMMSLKPKKYLPLAKKTARDESITFIKRYFVFKAVRSLYETKSPAVAQNDIVALMGDFLDVHDTADLAVIEYRKWKRWEATPRILALFELKTHQHRVTHNAILRFALRSPRPEAAAFVARMRKLDNPWVGDIEELLKLEEDLK